MKSYVRVIVDCDSNLLLKLVVPHEVLLYNWQWREAQTHTHTHTMPCGFLNMIVVTWTRHNVTLCVYCLPSLTFMGMCIVRIF